MKHFVAVDIARYTKWPLNYLRNTPPFLFFPFMKCLHNNVCPLVTHKSIYSGENFISLHHSYDIFCISLDLGNISMKNEALLMLTLLYGVPLASRKMINSRKIKKHSQRIYRGRANKYPDRLIVPCLPLP